MCRTNGILARQAAAIELTEQERELLQSWVRSGTTQQRLVFRARMILMASEGLATTEIARQLGCNPSTVSKWRQRFARQRIAGLQDAPRSGKPRRYTDEHRRQILAKLNEPPPQGYAQWNGRLLAEAIGVSADFVWAVLREYGISLQRRRS